MGESESGSEETDSDASVEGGTPEEQERRHFLDVVFAFADYLRDTTTEVVRMHKKIHSVVREEDKPLWSVEDPQKMLREIQVRLKHNDTFLQQLIREAGGERGVVGPPTGLGDDQKPGQGDGIVRVPAGHHVQRRNSSKVRSTLRQFVRDWALEGAAEREACYGPLLRSLQTYLPLTRDAPKAWRVCCPGSGLGRLPFDCARMGYAAQGNEFSYHMLLASQWVLNETKSAFCQSIFPFVLSTSNRMGKDDHLREIKIPDIWPTEEIKPGTDFSMCAGEFVEVYQDQKGEWDALLTPFFIDTAKNIFLYIRVFADILRPGGLWSNIGPLLYHYAEMEQEISIELSWEEIKPAIERYFEIKSVEFMDCSYTTNERSMSQILYHCIHFNAIRNNVPVQGKSHPVYT